MAWLSNWEKRIEITIDETQIDSDLTHFPIPIFLGTSVGQSGDNVSVIFDELGSNWQKIAVTKADGTTQIYIELENWDSSAETAVLWVSKSDLILSSASPTTLYLYYDNSKADNTTFVGTPGNRTEVWHSEIASRYSMREDPTITVVDSVGTNDASGENMDSDDDVSAKIYKGIEFNGNSNEQGLHCSGNSPINGISGFTIEAWVYANNISSKGPGHGGASGASNAIAESSGGDNMALQFGDSDKFYGYVETVNGDDSFTVDNAVSANTWYHVWLRYDGSYLRGYLNGNYEGGTAQSGDVISDGQSLTIGAHPSLRNVFDGIIDEFRVYSSVQSTNELETSRQAQLDNLLSFGAEEIIELGGNAIFHGVNF